MQRWFTVALVAGLALAGGTFVAAAPTAAEAATTPSADEILAKVDANMVTASRQNVVRMSNVKNGRTRDFVMQVYAKGDDQASIEYLEPTRDKGTKMLRVAEELWLYNPSVETVSKISGHMLRTGMSGTDVSYEDMMSASHWREDYTATVTGTETIDGKSCFKIEMAAKDSTIAYPKRIAWVDSTTYVPLKQEMYALSGMLLKVWTMSDVQAFGSRNYPTKMVVEDKVQAGSSTTMVLQELKFDVDVDPEVFTQRWLERH